MRIQRRNTDDSLERSSTRIPIGAVGVCFMKTDRGIIIQYPDPALAIRLNTLLCDYYINVWEN